jgi:hypothetical protein
MGFDRAICRGDRPDSMVTLFESGANGEDVGVPNYDARPIVTPALRYVAVALVVIAAVAAIVFLPGLLVSLDLGGGQVTTIERVTATNSARTTLLQAIAGLAVGLGAYAAWQRVRVNEEELRATRDGQITERYSRAVEHLGASSVDIRMGGVHALARVARNSPADADTIVALLCSFVRAHSPWPPGSPGQPPMESTIDQIGTLAIRGNDVQAAVTALGRIERTRLTERIAIPHVDLRRARLDGLALEQTNLEHVSLVRARLRKTVLRAARLRGADLRGADLRDADLRDSDLRSADLRTALLDGALLSGARADIETRWPERFDPATRGVLIEPS